MKSIAVIYVKHGKDKKGRRKIADKLKDYNPALIDLHDGDEQPFITRDVLIWASLPGEYRICRMTGMIFIRSLRSWTYRARRLLFSVWGMLLSIPTPLWMPSVYSMRL